MPNAIALPTSLADLVGYAEGSVASSVIFRNDGGTMTVFAFSEGQGLSEHVNPSDAIVVVLTGWCTVVIGDVEHRLDAGQALHLPATVPHEVVGGEPFKMLLTLLRTAHDD